MLFPNVILHNQRLHSALTLDSQIRRKIDEHLLIPTVTKAWLCRDLTKQLHTVGTKVQYNMLDAFRKKRGPSAGCTSSVYYAAYCFFENFRILRKDPKSKHRLEMERIWPHGMDRDRDDSKRG